MPFISCSELFLFFRYLQFRSDFLAMLKQQLDKKAIINFKIYAVTDRTTSKHNTHII